MIKSLNFSVFTFALICLIVLCSCSDLFAEQQDANEPEDSFDMSIEELLDVKIYVASKKSEPLIEAPGVVSVVTRNEIELYGDRNLHQLMQRK
jgi:outer membrane receptor for ferrienterochelin and colicin